MNFPHFMSFLVPRMIPYAPSLTLHTTLLWPLHNFSFELRYIHFADLTLNILLMFMWHFWVFIFVLLYKLGLFFPCSLSEDYVSFLATLFTSNYYIFNIDSTVSIKRFWTASAMFSDLSQLSAQFGIQCAINR